MVQDFVHQQDIGCSEFRFYISQKRCHTSFSSRKELGTLSAIIFRKCRRLRPSRFWSENFDFEMTEENKTCSGPRFPRIPMNKVQDSRTSPRFFGTLSGSCLIVPKNRRILGILGLCNPALCSWGFLGILGLCKFYEGLMNYVFSWKNRFPYVFWWWTAEFLQRVFIFWWNFWEPDSGCAFLGGF